MFRGQTHATALVLALVVSASVGCHRYRPMTIRAVQEQPQRVERASKVRLTAADGTSLEMVVDELQFPYMAGALVGGAGGRQRVNLNDVRRIEVHDGNSVLVDLVVIGTIGAVVMFATAASSVGI